jgi:hypothetical protein
MLAAVGLWLCVDAACLLMIWSVCCWLVGRFLMMVVIVALRSYVAVPWLSGSDVLLAGGSGIRVD